MPRQVFCNCEGTVFNEVLYYKPFKKYLLFLGQFPTQSRSSQRFSTTVAVCTSVSFIIPGILQFYASMTERDYNTAMECVPMLVTIMVSLIKLLNHSINKENFDRLFRLMKEEWSRRDENREQTLEKITKQGYFLAKAYRTTLLSFMVVFLAFPLLPVFLDIVLPLNETRQRRQSFKLKYYANEENHFFYVYTQIVLSSSVIVIIIVCMDSLYMMLVHHACALFAACGLRVIQATDRVEQNLSGTSIEQLKECVKIHKKAVRFYEIMDESTRLGYFFQVLFNMIGITVTAVQTALYLHKPEEAIRCAIFLVAQQFHLLVITLPGQLLQDYSSDLTNYIYFSTWYQMPLNIQRLLYTMQMRSSKVCKFRAGGLYEMNIENFGITFKACMSYFTMLLSLQE